MNLERAVIAAFLEFAAIDSGRDWLRRRSPSVAARIIRLNPHGIRPPGRRPRGWHPKPRYQITRDLMSKGAFLRRWGRDEWARVPRTAIWKDGRREFVTGLYVMQAGLR